MRMNNEIPKEVFSRKQQEVGERIAELEQRMAQYGDVEPATGADVSGKLENLQMARSFRDSLEFCVIVYDKIEKW